MKKSGTYGLGLFCAGVMAIIACMVVHAALGQMVREETAALHTRVREAAVNCYAAEGRYPRSLSYLEQAYGLRYDKTRFSIYYDAFASNILPDIDVQAIGEAGAR